MEIRELVNNKSQNPFLIQTEIENTFKFFIFFFSEKLAGSKKCTTFAKDNRCYIMSVVVKNYAKINNNNARSNYRNCF